MFSFQVRAAKFCSGGRKFGTGDGKGFAKFSFLVSRAFTSTLETKEPPTSRAAKGILRPRTQEVDEAPCERGEQKIFRVRN